MKYATLRQLTSAKIAWTLIGSYKELYDKAKFIIKEDMCMK